MESPFLSSSRKTIPIIKKKCANVIPPTPIQTFRRFFSDEVFDLILEQSNIYGRRKYQQANDINNWIDITKSELEKFLGINIIMGYCKNPSIDSYWSSDASLRNERISTSMSCKAFKRILGSLHLVDNVEAERSGAAQSNKLYTDKKPG